MEQRYIDKMMPQKQESSVPADVNKDGNTSQNREQKPSEFT